MRNTNQRSADELPLVRSCIRRTPPADFSGETNFVRLTPSQKLDALASLAAFVKECKGLASYQSVAHESHSGQGPASRVGH